MGVSKNRGGPPQIIHFNKVFHYKPSILGGKHPLFLGWHPYWQNWMKILRQNLLRTKALTKAGGCRFDAFHRRSSALAV